VAVVLQGFCAEGRLDEMGFLQVTVEVDQPVRPTSMRGSRWQAMDDDSPSMTYQMTKQELSAQRQGSKRHTGARFGCVIGYFFFTAIITRVYWAQGAKIVLFVLCYLISLAFMTISIKHIYVEYNFRYPKFITAFHLLFSALVGFIVLLSRARATGKEIVVPRPYEFLSRIIPISVCFGGAIGLSNIGLLTVSPLLAEILGSLNPLAAVPFTLMMGIPFQLILLAPITIVVAGAVTAVQPWTFKVAVEAGGIICILLGVVLRAVKTVLQQEVMTGVLSERFDEYTLLAWSSVTSSALMFGWSAASERGEPWAEFAGSARRPALLATLAVSVLIAIIVNLSHLWVTKVLGAVSSQLLGQTKAVLILLASIAFLGDKTCAAELVGFGLVLLGTFLYGILQQKLLFSGKS